MIYRKQISLNICLWDRWYLFKPMQLFVMLPIIDTQHMTCFENFTRIMDVKSMIIDQSCVTAGLYTAKFYGWLKILIFKKSPKHASKRIFLSALYWNCITSLKEDTLHSHERFAIVCFPGFHYIPIYIWTRSHVWGFQFLVIQNDFVVLWYMIITISTIDHNAHVVPWENCTLDSTKYL